jgi:hypothetical protein
MTETTTETKGGEPAAGASLDPVTISVQNLSTVLSDTEAEAIVQALNTQATRDYNSSCWVTQGLAAPAAAVEFIPKGETIPADTWHMELLDTSDQEGALGYHEDEAFDKAGAPTGPKKSSNRTSRGLRADAPEIPLMKIFVKTSQEDSVQPGEVASHEMLEALVDPQVVKEVRTVNKSSEGRIYIVEVGDPVQSSGYKIGDVEVANFALPAYFGYPQEVNPTQYDYGHVLTEMVPAMTPGGYMSYAPASEPENWQQVFGSAH